MHSRAGATKFNLPGNPADQAGGGRRTFRHPEQRRKAGSRFGGRLWQRGRPLRREGLTETGSDDLSLFDAIYTQRTIRSFRLDPVPREIVTRIVEAATKAPSGGNSQPWAFIAVQDEALRKALAVFARDGFQTMYERGEARRQPDDPLCSPASGR